MLHNAKRGLSIVLALLMCLSMVTAVVLPATAEATDAYAKITATADGDVYVPAANVYFYDPVAFATAPEGVIAGDAFEYTYGDGAIWGNGKTYRLTWGANTLSNIAAVKALIQSYNADWSADAAAMNRDLVIVFAPGTSGYLNDFELKAAGGVTDPTADQLMNLYLLGPQAGKNPVSAKKNTKEEAKEIQNDRSVDPATEHIWTDTFWMPSFCNFYFDGFGITKACRLYQGYTYVNHYFSNLYFADQTAPAGNSIIEIGGYDKNVSLEMKDCYININKSMTRADLTSEQNRVFANKILIDNCVFTGGMLSASAAKCYYQTNHFQFYPNRATTASKNFYGDYATKPLIQVTNTVGVDWESAHLFRNAVNNANSYAGYDNNVVTINYLNNKFYDVGFTNKSSADTIFVDQCTTADQADSYTLNIKNNLFSLSDEVFGKGTTSVTNAMNFRGSLAKEGSTSIVSKYKINIKDNIFIAPNNKQNSQFAQGAATMVPVDVGGNLFLDTEGNVLPAYLHGASPVNQDTMWNVQSDLYASAAMKGGIRELMTVKEVNGGTVLYSYITQRRRGNITTATYLTGALTLLLKRGEEYDADTFVKLADPDVKYLGMYTEEACTNKVDKISQDTVNGKFIKLQYKEAGTTLTVVYTLNTPRNYLIVDPDGAYADGYTFNGVTYKSGERATDGVYAVFYTHFDNGAGNDVSAYAKANQPPQNDLIAVGSQTWKDRDGVNYLYNNALNDLILLTPGTHNFSTSNKLQGIGKYCAIVGAQWGVSPYGEANKEGKLANGRSFDPTKESVVTGGFAPSSTNALFIAVDGVAFNSNAGACAFQSNGACGYSAMNMNFQITNCVFTGNGVKGYVIANDPAETDTRVLDMVMKDCAYDGTGVTRTNANPLIYARANQFTLENFAVVNDTSKLGGTSNRVVYLKTTDGTKVKMNAKRVYADIKNVTIYNSNRDLFLYTLRDTTTINANFDCYPQGMELNITGAYVTGGLGYLWGIQNGEATGSLKFVKANITNNYFYRPDYDANVISHYQTGNYQKIDNSYTDDSVCADNIFVVKEKFKANAYKATLNIDDNFFGKVVDGKVVPSYVTSTAAGIVKDTKDYWINPEMTVKNAELGLVDNGYKAFEMSDFKGYNQYTVDATNMTASVDMFKAAEGATIVGVYTDDACTTAATAFTHPQVVYVKVTKGDLTLVNKVDVDCVCSHDGTTTEKVIVDATCTVAGSKGNVCDYCDELVGNPIEIPSTGHTADTVVTVDTAPTCKDTGLGHYKCTVCGEVAEANIVVPVVACVAADELVVDRTPNCSDKGEAHSVCKWCGKTLQTGLEIGYGDHIWNDDYTVVEYPTCTVQGNKEIQCSLCGTPKEGSNVMIDMLPHPWNDDYTIDVAPTCQADGSKSIRCSVCETQKEESEVIIPMGQHVWETKYTVVEEATCVDYGLESIKCSLCDVYKEGSDRRTPKSDHTWDTEYTVDIEPTCTEQGKQSIYCSLCLALKEGSTVAIPTTEHNWDDRFTFDSTPTCTEDGEKSRWCLDCGEARTDITAIPSVGHDHFYTVVTVLPTFAADGVSTNYCGRCDEPVGSTVIPKLEGVSAAEIFEDIEQDDWFVKNEAIDFVYNFGLMNGTSDTTFSPEAPITRGMFVTILGRLYGVDITEYADAKLAFKDVSAKAYYAPYVAWAYNEGIVNGYSATTFGPDKNITREQICKMILEFCNTCNITVEATNKAITFADAAEISGYAKKYVKTCQRAGLVNGEKIGSKYYFRPQDTATRAEAATMIRNFCYAYYF